MHERKGLIQKKSVRALAACLIVYMAVSFLPDSFLYPVRMIVTPITEPFQGFFSWLAFEARDTFGVATSISDIKRENEALQRDKLALEQEVALLREAREENRLLRESMGLSLREVERSLSAEVISRDTNGLAMSFLINRGRTDDIEVGMPVVVGKGALIGRVSAVFVTSAEVRLLSHPDSVVAGRVAGSSVQGVVRGDHGLGLLFDMALSGEALQSGQPILSSGLGDGFPKDLLIGHIKEVRPSADRLFQQASIVAPVSLTDTRFVSVLFSKPL